MKYQHDAPSVAEGLGLSPERTNELHNFTSDAFEVLRTAEQFTTADVVSTLAPNIHTAAEAFYVGWIARGVLVEYATT